MVVELYTFNVLVPAGTAIATPQITAMTMPTRRIRWVEWIVPPGPGGNVGFRIASNGTQQIPVNAGAWIIRDNDKRTFDFESRVTTGAWQLIAYNLGVFAHMLEITFGVDPIGVVDAVPRLQPVALGGTL